MYHSHLYRKGRRKLDDGIAQGYINNAKGHIHKMIQRKKDQQGDYIDVKKSIQSRREQKHRKIRRSIVNQFKLPDVEGQ